ncbi:sigma E protease regulator RseP [Glaciecola sp. XM2]|uniref:sigma E protease regulator RseP n=1 Tax=Glaciecola sp. XM2 TaxID=1914931 RepID=UPI001BDED104|nr:sigma E protease regulator RseP [Glaciecola sp. XM2]MBT1450738.1 sigma E protease regulator RseP [Glaciecola sp. XM2]
MEIIRNIFFFVIALGILVAVHEWGHYYVAKLCKVKILRFSIGFGKPLYQRVTSSGMEFVIAMIPLGGYVRMLDGRVDDVAPQDEHVAFNTQPVWQRIAIVAAGPMVNFIFAIFAMAAIGMIGQQTPKPIVGDIAPDSFAAQSRLSVGDEILAIDNHRISTWRDVAIELSTFSGEQSIPLTVKNANGVTQDVNLPIDGWKIDPDEADLFTALGFQPFRPAVTKKLGFIDENTPASRAGFQVDDEIEKLDGTTLENWGQIVSFIEQRPNQTSVATVLRDGQRVELNVTFGEKPNNPEQGYLGVIPYQDTWPEEYVLNRKLGPIDAIVEGTEQTWRLMGVTLTMLGKLLTGDVSVKNLSGPISIAQGAGISASIGIVAFLSFLALISVNLGIINLLPLPILDGGHLMYFTIEWITGKPVSEAIQEVGFKIGGVILFAVMATAIINDVLRNT